METPEISEASKQAMLQHHLASYDKLLQYAVSRFSCKKLYERLTLLIHTLTALQSSTSDNKSDSPSIGSLDELHQVLVYIGEKAGSESEEETSIEIVHYFDSFFEELQFLRELKKFFDQCIHRHLYEYYYDPIDDLHPEVDDSALAASSGSEFLTGAIGSGSNVHEVSNKGRLGYMVRKLYSMCKKWDNLLQDGEIDQDSFDIESAKEIRIYPNSSRFESILRLIPDLCAKSFHAFELAQSWSKEALKVYGDSMASSTSVKNITKRQEVMKERILSLTLEISEAEEKLHEEYKELRTLQEREHRHLTLDQDCKKLENIRKNTQHVFTELLEAKDNMIKGNRSLMQKNSDDVKESYQTWKQVEWEIFTAEGELHVLDFQLGLLRADQDLELLFLPDIVHYISDAEVHINSLKQSLQERKHEREMAENTIFSIKENCAKMREIIDKYYNHQYSSGVSVETNEAGDTLSTCTSEEGESDDELIENDRGYVCSASTTIHSVNTPYRDLTLPMSAIPRESLSQSSGILKHSAKRLIRTGSLPSSPFREASLGGEWIWEGKDGRMSEVARTKTVRWKIPPVSDGSDDGQEFSL